MSATAFGIGRLLIWEDFALGLRTSFSHGLGHFTSDGTYHRYSNYQDESFTTEAWGMVAISRRASVFARAPAVVVHRSAGSLSDTGGGLGDIGLGLRHEFVQIGEYMELPAIALTLSLTTPSGRAPDATHGDLGADVTGRGAFAVAAGLSFESTVLPWYVRLDLGTVIPLPFVRDDTGKTQWLGPELDMNWLLGLEVSDGFVWSLGWRFAWHAPVHIDGHPVRASARIDTGLALAAALRLDEHWTLQLACDTHLPIDHLGRNGLARLTSTLGVRYGHF